jgi:hypothetical protein
MIIPKLYLPFSSIELQKLLKHSFDRENITTTDEDFNRFRLFNTDWRELPGHILL